MHAYAGGRSIEMREGRALRFAVLVGDLAWAAILRQQGLPFEKWLRLYEFRR